MSTLTISSEDRVSDDERRGRLYAGEIFDLPPTTRSGSSVTSRGR